jgi:hypothetical protein
VFKQTPRCEDVWGVEVQLHAFLNSAADEGKWSASRPGHFTLRKRAVGIPDGQEDGGARADLRLVAKRKGSASPGSRTRVVQPVS